LGYLFSPEFSYRPGLGSVAEDNTTTTNSISAPTHVGSGGPPNRPLPPTPDDDDAQADRTLIKQRVSFSHFPFDSIIFIFNLKYSKSDNVL
jgi:hypothetical protein